jgi:molybdate transport system regulatory protein
VRRRSPASALASRQRVLIFHVPRAELAPNSLQTSRPAAACVLDLPDTKKLARIRIDTARAESIATQVMRYSQFEWRNSNDSDFSLVMAPKKTLDSALGHQVTDKRLDILRRLGKAGSISEAARGAGVSYKAAWQAIETLNNLAGEALVEKVVGGAGGGGSRLTSAGERLLVASDRLHAARRSVLQKLDRETRKQAGVPNLSALGLRTSMRNVFPCKVGKLKKLGASLRVELVLGNGTALYSRITRESAELLGLVVGVAVLLLCKATAVTVARELKQREGYNLLQGKVTRTAASARGGEISLQLEGGLQLVGFADAGHGLKAGQMAMAAVEESAVVIAVPA